MSAFNDIAHWRTLIFGRLLTVCMALGVLTAVPSIALAWREGLWSVVALDCIAILWVGAIWFFDRAPYKVRVLNFLGIVYLIGIGLMMAVGPISQIYLLAAPVLAGMLLGVRPAIVALGLSAVTIFSFTLTGRARLHVAGMPDFALAQSVIITLNFLFIGVLLTLSSGVLLRRLSRSFDELRGFADSLEQGRNELQQVNAELRLTAAAVAGLNDMVLIAKVVDDHTVQPIIFANDAFVRRSGYRRDEILGRSMRLLHGPDTDAAEVARIAEAMARYEAVSAELVHYTKAGDPFWVEIDLVPFTDEVSGTNTHWVAVGRDITERRKTADAIHQLAFFDVLTGLPNRRLLMDRLDKQLAAAQRGLGTGAVMFIDLDRFKYINDARGHATGDALLRSAAQRLSALMRKSDTVARLGGDEFVVLMSGPGQGHADPATGALAFAEKIRQALSQDFVIDGQAYNSSASIGVALLPKPGQTVQDLLREADIAMYHAKAEGRNKVAFFEATMQAGAEQRLTLERDLALALDRNELQVHLQVQVDAGGTPSGAELLIRWQRADGSTVPPDKFIPAAESSGMIVPIGYWVLRQACQAWSALSAAGHALPISVNVSPFQFRQADFVQQVKSILAESGTPASQLILEVTEGLFIDKLDDTIALMHELVSLGFRFSIDDFGTGYSSLAYLKRLPLYELKIDKSFIHDTPCDPNGTAIVQSILAMAGHLGLRVVAEGVETPAQSAFLSSNGAPNMQGFLFGRPMPLAELVALLGERSAPAQRCAA